ncbi:MAG: hypothetical protein ACK4G1_06910 [Ignavibacteria bacterium]
MDFVKFYIVQLVKNAASRIRLIDKEKEKLLSKLVARIENSQELFPDLKIMERVVELEETASKLISIYRRLNKSHIDLEKISYQFTNDRDAIQSILRRFLQGNFRNGIVRKKRPKIVFDDTTFTIYELKEPEEVETENKVAEGELKPKVELNDFLNLNDEEIVSVKTVTSSEQIEIEGQTKNDIEEITADEMTSSTTQNEDISKNTSLEIDNGIAKKSLSKTVKEKEFNKSDEELILPLEFEWNENIKDKITDEKNIDEALIESNEIKSDESLESDEQFQEATSQTKKIDEKIFETKSDTNDFSESLSEQRDENLSEANQSSDISNLKTESIEQSNQLREELDTTDKDSTSEELIKTIKEENNNLYLDFEKLILDNILEVDEFLNQVLNQKFDDEQILKLIQKAYRSLQLAEELNFTLISELIKVYWLSLVAIRDNNMRPDKFTAELIRSTLIILVTLIKQRDIDLEPFMQKHNQLKEELKKLDYEV